MEGIAAAKAALRYGMLIRRDQLAATCGSLAAQALMRVALQILWSVGYGRDCGRGGVVAGYWPMAGEIDICPLLQRLSTLGYRLALPMVVAKGQPLVFRAWHPTLVPEAGLHGTRHPPTGAGRVAPNVVLVPLLAFDQAGFRLGFGGGYYDRTLTRLRRLRKGRVAAVGIAFAGQEVPWVPRQACDAALDLVWCERGVIRPRRFVPMPLRRDG